jgi:hypothetical protein
MLVCIRRNNGYVLLSAAYGTYVIALRIFIMLEHMVHVFNI